MHFKYFLYKRKGETFPPIFPVLIFCLKAAAFIHQSLFMKKSWWYTGEGMVCCSSKSIDYCAMNKYFTKANRILYENEKKKQTFFLMCCVNFFWEIRYFLKNLFTLQKCILVIIISETFIFIMRFFKVIFLEAVS